MERVIDDLTRQWFSPTQIAAGYDRYIKACLTYVRMDQCQLAVMPWLRAALPDLQAMNVLEVGCGTGISTAPMAFAAKRVLAFDIDQPSVDAARSRCDFLGVTNAEIFTRGVDWIENYARDRRSLTTEDVDLGSTDRVGC